MLILSRKVDERIIIGDEIEISVIDIKGDQVKIGINAPRSIKVYRKEVYEAIQRENVEAAKARPAALPEWEGFVDRAGRMKDAGPPEAGGKTARGKAPGEAEAEGQAGGFGGSGEPHAKPRGRPPGKPGQKG
jgi:carbon storage regulator